MDVICGCEVLKGFLRNSKKVLWNLIDIRKKCIYWLIVIKFNSFKENFWGRLEKVSMWGRVIMKKNENYVCYLCVLVFNEKNSFFEKVC